LVVVLSVCITLPQVAAGQREVLLELLGNEEAGQVLEECAADGYGGMTVAGFVTRPKLPRTPPAAAPEPPTQQQQEQSVQPCEGDATDQVRC
jgi:hypothetical protein